MFVFKQGDDFLKKYLFILKNCPFFSGMSEEEILSILNCIDAKVLCKEANEYILRAGDSTTSMGLVLKGSVHEVRNQFKTNRYHIRIQASDGNIPSLDGPLCTELSRVQENEHIYNICIKKQPDASNSELLRDLCSRAEILSFSEEIPSMHDIFIQVVSNNPVNAE